MEPTLGLTTPFKKHFERKFSLVKDTKRMEKAIMKKS